MSEMNDRAHTRAQYATEGNLETRRAIWHPAAGGRDAVDLTLAAIRAEQPTRVLEVGSGPGVFASRLAAELPGVDLLATDQSERFVELTATRGVAAQVADVQDLPNASGSYDVVVAMWMLYHVPDLQRGLAEIRRVLRPGGLFVAVTNGSEHIAQLRRDAGGSALLTQFSSENGEAALLQHFSSVGREDLMPRAAFPDHASAVAYLSSAEEEIDWDLPWFDGPREYAGHVTVFVAR